MIKRRSITYADREILAPRIGQRVNFEVKTYKVRGYSQVTKDYGIFKIMALDMREINNPSCEIGHMLIKLRVPKHVYHYANAILSRKQPLRFSAVIRRYKHKVYRHSNNIFKQLEAVQKGEVIGEVEPLHTFGLNDARIKLPFDLNFELNDNQYEKWTDYTGDFATEVRRHIMFTETLDWLKENIGQLGESDQAKLFTWVERLRCCDLNPQDEEFEN